MHCLVHAAFAGAVTILATGQASAQDVQALCAKLGNNDKIKTIPASLVPKARQLFSISNTPAGFIRKTTSFRCMGGKAWLCNTGANLDCGKANTSRNSPGATGLLQAKPRLGCRSDGGHRSRHDLRVEMRGKQSDHHQDIRDRRSAWLHHRQLEAAGLKKPETSLDRLADVRARIARAARDAGARPARGDARLRFQNIWRAGYRARHQGWRACVRREPGPGGAGKMARAEGKSSRSRTASHWPLAIQQSAGSGAFFRRD